MVGSVPGHNPPPPTHPPRELRLFSPAPFGASCLFNLSALCFSAELEVVVPSRDIDGGMYARLSRLRSPNVLRRKGCAARAANDGAFCRSGGGDGAKTEAGEHTPWKSGALLQRFLRNTHTHTQPRCLGPSQTSVCFGKRPLHAGRNGRMRLIFRRSASMNWCQRTVAVMSQSLLCCPHLSV